MKGPGFRRDLDVRRVWKCPACGRVRKLTGQVTTVLCECQPQGRWMEIIDDRLSIPQPPKLMVTPEIPVADFHLTEEELAKPLEGRIRRRPGPRPTPEETKGRPDGPAVATEPSAVKEERPATQEAPGNPPRDKPRRPQRPRRERPEQGSNQSVREDVGNPAPHHDVPPPSDEFAAGIE